MKKTVVIAGGGTGGHIYPAIAIANALKIKDPEIEIHFVGATGGLEEKLVPKEGFPLHLMKVGKLNYIGGSFAKIKTLLSMPLLFLRCILLLLKLRPGFVLGVGGFASGPIVATASLLKFPTAIWEPNAFPGMTNRWLSKFVKTSFVVFAEAMKFLRSREKLQRGLPVRKNLELMHDQILSPREGRKFHLLSFGGSQGARAINEALSAAVKQAGWREDIEIVHQTGRFDFQKIRELYEGEAGVEVHEFLYDMDERYAWADAVLCRSGASTLAELASCKKAALLVPLPTAADDHQRKNAEALEASGAAEMILQSELTPELLIQKILFLKEKEQHRQDLATQVSAFHIPRAAETIADDIIERSAFKG